MKTKSILIVSLLTVCMMTQAQKSMKDTQAYPQDVQVKTIDGFSYLYYEFQGSYMKAFEEFPDLMEYIGQHGIPMGPYSLGVYYDDPADVPENELRSEIGMLVTAPVNSGPYKYKEIPGFKAVTIKYTDMEHIQPAYNELFDYVEKQGLIPDGPAYEFYYSYETNNMNAEIILPVKD